MESKIPKMKYGWKTRLKMLLKIPIVLVGHYKKDDKKILSIIWIVGNKKIFRKYLVEHLVDVHDNITPESLKEENELFNPLPSIECHRSSCTSEESTNQTSFRANRG